MGAYYYAAGRKVELEDDDEHVAVDQKVAERAGLDRQVKTASTNMTRPSGGVVLAQRSALGEDTVARLREAGALQPVYKRNQAVIVALPEVRIEFDHPEQRDKVMDVLAESRSAQHLIAENTEERIVVRPASGSGDDALQMANEIYERAHPAAASVRFIQFVPKPSLRP
jgi:hypothetical protein